MEIYNQMQDSEKDMTKYDKTKAKDLLNRSSKSIYSYKHGVRKRFYTSFANTQLYQNPIVELLEFIRYQTWNVYLKKHSQDK